MQPSFSLESEVWGQEKKKKKKAMLQPWEWGLLEKLWAGILVHGIHCEQIEKKPPEFLRELYCQSNYKPIIITLLLKTQNYA